MNNFNFELIFKLTFVFIVVNILIGMLIASAKVEVFYKIKYYVDSKITIKD